jgi:hypothetical protein
MTTEQAAQLIAVLNKISSTLKIATLWFAFYAIIKLF